MYLAISTLRRSWPGKGGHPVKRKSGEFPSFRLGRAYFAVPRAGVALRRLRYSPASTAPPVSTPAALTTLLDEAAFWLGALATGESGMTTELRVSLHRPAPFDATVTVAGARASVRPREHDARYQDTEIVARAGDQVVATARITFVVVRGAARRLVNGMLAINDAECVRRVFPAYTR